MAPAGCLCVRGWQLCVQIPLLIPGQGLEHLLPTEALADCWRVFSDVFSGSPGGSQGQGRSMP